MPLPAPPPRPGDAPFGKVRLAPSILSADFSRLGEQIAGLEQAGAKQLHLDVMDGHFVENLTFGPLVVDAIRRTTRLPLDVHLQIENADRWIEAFCDVGADMIAVHPETLLHPDRTIQSIRDHGRKAGAAMAPSTPMSQMEELLPKVDYVIVMSVYPGFAGQGFIPGSFARLERLRSIITRDALPVELEIDGGIDTGNVKEAVTAGADVVVAGSAIFNADDPPERLRAMLEEILQADRTEA